MGDSFDVPVNEDACDVRGFTLNLQHTLVVYLHGEPGCVEALGCESTRRSLWRGDRAVDERQGRLIRNFVSPEVDLDERRGADGSQPEERLFADLGSLRHNLLLDRLERPRRSLSFGVRPRQRNGAVQLLVYSSRQLALLDPICNQRTPWVFDHRAVDYAG